MRVYVGLEDKELYDAEHKTWPWYWAEDATRTTRASKELSAEVASWFGVEPVSRWTIGYNASGGGGRYNHGTRHIHIRTARSRRGSRSMRIPPLLYDSNVIHETCHHVAEMLGFNDRHGPNFRAFLEIAMNRYALANGRAVGDLPRANARLIEIYGGSNSMGYHQCSCGWQVRDDQLDQHLREWRNRH